MQLNKILKWLMLVIPIMAITACSDYKSANNRDETAMDDDASTYMNNNSSSSNEQAHLQIQRLIRNNIVYFDLNKYDIRSEFFQILDAHANFLRSNPSYKVIVEGHADEHGTPEYNIALGERRAFAIKMYLQGKGVSAEQIAVISYGKEKPAILGHNEAAYAKNRRTVLAY